MNTDPVSIINSMQVGGLIMAILVGIFLILIRMDLRDKKDKKD